MVTYFSRVVESLNPLRPRLVEPTSIADVPAYDEAFRRCVNFSRSRTGQTDMLLRETADSPQRLHEPVVAAMRAARIENAHLKAAAGQCLKWSYYLAPFVEKETGLKAWPTVGQLWKDDRRVFGYSWEEMRAIIKNGLHLDAMTSKSRSGIDWHAWITFETGEVLDLTFFSTLAHVFPESFEDKLGVFLCGSPSELIVNYRYFPMLAGATAMEYMQSRSQFAFLAQKTEDLLTVDGLLWFEKRS